MWILVIHILRNVLDASKWKEIRLVSLSLLLGYTVTHSGKYSTVVSVFGQNQSGRGLHLVRREEEEKHCSPGLCHVTFCSSVNVVDYFLRDQNWLPRIRPPSISAESGTQAGARPARTHGTRTAWSRCLNRWWSNGATQLVTQYKPQLWLFIFLVVSQKKIGFWGTEREFKSNQIHFGIHVKLFLKEVSRFLQNCEMPELHGGLHLYRDTSDLTTTVSIILGQIMILLTVQLKLPDCINSVFTARTFILNTFCLFIEKREQREIVSGDVAGWIRTCIAHLSTKTQHSASDYLLVICFSITDFSD